MLDGRSVLRNSFHRIKRVAKFAVFSDAYGAQAYLSVRRVSEAGAGLFATDYAS